ncbi:hypothetical protein Chor_000923 [Crotalus horridus]
MYKQNIFLYIVFKATFWLTCYIFPTAQTFGEVIKLDVAEPQRKVWDNSSIDSVLKKLGEAELQLETDLMDNLNITSEVSKATLTVGKSDDTRAVISVEGKSSIEADNNENMAKARLQESVLAHLSPEPTLMEEELKLFPTDDLEAEFLEETQRNKCQTDIFPVAEVWVNEGKEKETMSEVHTDNCHYDDNKDLAIEDGIHKKMPIHDEPSVDLSKLYRTLVDVPSVADVQNQENLEIDDVEDVPIKEHSDSEEIALSINAPDGNHSSLVVEYNNWQNCIFGETDTDLQELQASMEQLLREQPSDEFSEEEETTLKAECLGNDTEVEEDGNNFSSESAFNEEWHSDVNKNVLKTDHTEALSNIPLHI